MDKKSEQLGMNAGTAQARLLRDILWKLVQETGQDTCCKCSEKMTRATYSIEHVVPWLDSNDPYGRFFDLENIAFSHLICNVRAARRTNKKGCGHVGSYARGCRCDACRAASALSKKNQYTPEKRRDKYLTTGQ